MTEKTITKTIGIVAVKASENLIVNNAYYNFLTNRISEELSHITGELININLKIIDPLSDIVDEKLDLLFLQGGADVDPLRYNKKPNPYNSKPNTSAEYFDVYILPKYIESKIPIFGVCRGMQSLNVLFGGTLNQHIVQQSSIKGRNELVNKLDFTSYNKQEYLDFIPGVSLNKGEIKNPNSKNKYMVNSIHHQGVYFKDLSKELLPLAINVDYAHDNYRNIEAFRHKELPIVGIQWHPEELNDPVYSINIIKSLLSL